MIPTAIQDMARAAQNVGKIDKALGLNEAVAAMLKLQQEGKLISSEILPEFGRVLSRSASKGLEPALLSNRVAMNRFMFSIQEAADTFFKSGFAEGLTKFFNSTSESIRKLEPLWKGLGKIIGSIFTFLAAAIEKITPVFVLLGELIDGITEAFGNTYAAVALLFSPVTLKGMKLFGSIFARILTPVLAVASAIEQTAFWLEEIINLFTGAKVGVLFDPRKSEGKLSQVMKHFTPDIQAELAQVAKFTGSGSASQASKPNLSNANNSGFQSVQLNATVNLDGEKVGQMILENPQNQSSVYSMIGHAMN